MRLFHPSFIANVVVVDVVRHSKKYNVTAL
jgi:hypothetical protein